MNNEKRQELFRSKLSKFLSIFQVFSVLLKFVMPFIPSVPFMSTDKRKKQKSHLININMLCVCLTHTLKLQHHMFEDEYYIRFKKKQKKTIQVFRIKTTRFQIGYVFLISVYLYTSF